MPSKIAKESLKTRPKKVALVALGPSLFEFIKVSFNKKGKPAYFDEVWTVNRGHKLFWHDKVFCLDDLKWIEKEDAFYAQSLRDHPMPILTSTAYPEYPMAVEYPVKEVIKTIGDDLLNNTVCYAVAYAIHIRVKELSIYGADFFYNNAVAGEEGGQAVAYLLGMARHFGMTFRIPQASTMLRAHTVRKDPETGEMGRMLYGYHRKTGEQANDPAIFWNANNPAPSPQGAPQKPDGEAAQQKESPDGPGPQTPQVQHRQDDGKVGDAGDKSLRAAESSR